MSIIRQQSLFDMHDLYEMESTHHFEAIFSTLNLNPIWVLFDKPKKAGASVELNYGAILYSLIARVVERIVTIKDMINRLKRDPVFRYDCGFLHSDQISSESSYSRMITTISESDAMVQIHDQLLLLAIDEGHISEKTLPLMQPTSRQENVQKPLKRRKSQYIIAGLTTSGNLHDGKVAIPLLKKIAQDVPALFTAGLLDAGYDYEPIYQQLMEQPFKLSFLTISVMKESWSVMMRTSHQPVSWNIPIAMIALTKNTKR